MTATLETTATRKARGAFFTPPDLCRYVSEWAVRSGADDVLEPSCGDAAFLLAAAAAQQQRQAGGRRGRLDGVEIHPSTAARARAVLDEAGHEADVIVSDFFEFTTSHRYDAVVGNPPFIRFHGHAGADRAASRAAAARAGVHVSALASSWAAFTVHAASFLRTGGRLGLVLPAELLSVNYAAQVRRHLVESFARVQLVLFTERVFPDVQAEVVLLLAEGFGQGPATHCDTHHVRNLHDLVSGGAVVSRYSPPPGQAKWSEALMPVAGRAAWADVLGQPGVSTLDAWGDTTLGMVTGNNDFFALSPEQASTSGLADDDVLPLSPPGSRHLRNLDLSPGAWSALGRAGARTLLLRPAGEPSTAAARYIARGASAGVDQAYKCRVRTPWWRVPLVEPPHLFVTCMNADSVRVISNSAGVHHLNSVHGVRLHHHLGGSPASLLPIAALSTLTLLGAELVGRSYGGGLLKVEPREADRLPVPAPEVLAACAEPLAALREHVDGALPGEALRRAARLVDEVLLVGGMGMRPSAVRELQEAHQHLWSRRLARAGRAPQGP